MLWALVMGNRADLRLAEESLKALPWEGQHRSVLCAAYTYVASHFPPRISSQPHSEDKRGPLQNIVLCASQCAEKQAPLGSYQPNRPTNTHYPQMPNKLATQTLPFPFSPPN